MLGNPKSIKASSLDGFMKLVAEYRCNTVWVTPFSWSVAESEENGVGLHEFELGVLYRAWPEKRGRANVSFFENWVRRFRAPGMLVDRGRWEDDDLICFATAVSRVQQLRNERPQLKVFVSLAELEVEDKKRDELMSEVDERGLEPFG